MKSYFPDILDLLKVSSGNLLEIGSGEGDFLIYASKNSEFKVQGYDVLEHAGLDPDRKTRVKNKLRDAGLSAQNYIWLSKKESLPFKHGTFDTIVSIQTLEHVENVERVFTEIYALLKPGGFALHYFPSAEILIDPHSGVPLAHKFPTKRKVILSFFSSLGFGKFKLYANKHNYSKNEFVKEFDNYLTNKCFYRNLNYYMKISEKIGLDSWYSPPPPMKNFPFLTKFISLFTSIYMFQKKPH